MLSVVFGVARFIGVSSVSFGVIGVRSEVRRVRSGSMGSLGCAMWDVGIGSVGVVGLVRGHWVHLGLPWGTSGSLGLSGIIGLCLGVHRVCSGSMSSLGCALGVVVFVGGRWVHLGALWGTFGSFGLAWFIVVRHGSRRVRLDSLKRSALRVVGFVWCRWVHWVAHWVSSGSFGVAGFIRIRRGGRRVRSGTLDSLGSSLVSPNSFLVAGLIGLRPGVHRLRLASLRSFSWPLGIVLFVRGCWVHWGASWVSSDRSGRCVLCGVPRGSSGSQDSLRCALAVVGFVRCRCVYFLWRRGRSGSLASFRCAL